MTLIITAGAPYRCWRRDRQVEGKTVEEGCYDHEEYSPGTAGRVTGGREADADRPGEAERYTDRLAEPGE